MRWTKIRWTKTGRTSPPRVGVCRGQFYAHARSGGVREGRVASESVFQISASFVRVYLLGSNFPSFCFALDPG